MKKITRLLVRVLPFLFALTSCNRVDNKGLFDFSTRTGSIVIENRTSQLKVYTKNGLNLYSLFDKKNYVILTKSDYYYGFVPPQKVKVRHKILTDNRREITFTGFTDDLEVIHSFVFYESEDWFEKYLSLKNNVLNIRLALPATGVSLIDLSSE